MYNEGGYYSDMRQVCINPFDEYIPHDAEIFLAKDLNKIDMYSAFICAIPGHPWIRKVIDIVMNNVEQRYYGKNPLYPTGSKMLVI